jgi:tetratricopeptide (TPR) repeat protein
MLLGVALRSLAAPEFLGEAQAELRQALMLDPGLHWARFALARIYLDLGRDTRALEELEAGLKGLPNQPLFLSFLGEVYRRLGQPQRSLQLNEEALTRAPNLSIPRLHGALAWRDLDEPERAVKELEAGLQAEPVLPEMLRTLGILYLKIEKVAQAIRILEKAVALDPSNGEGHLQLARACLQQQQPDKALRQLTQALPAGRPMLTSAYFQTLEADVHFVRGEAYRMKGMKKAALEAYQRAVEIDPDHREARDRLARPY